jgi:hypothetical protein
MRTNSLRLAIAAIAVLSVLPALAAVEAPPAAREPNLRPELLNVEPPLEPLVATPPPAPLINPHEEIEPPVREGGGTLDEIRIELPRRHDSMLDELWIERDARPNPDGSPRLKDLNPRPRRR